MYNFDGIQKIISLDPGTTLLNVQDLYSKWKEWLILPGNAGYLPAFNTIGGEGIGGGQNISPYYVLINNWKVRPYEGNHQLVVVGNLITDDESPSFVSTLGSFNVQISSVVAANSITQNLDFIQNVVEDTNTKIDAVQVEIDEHRAETENRIKLILGLTQHNFKIFDTTYDSNNLLTSSKVRIYENQSDLNSNINHTAEYEMSSTYDSNGLLTSYKMTQV